VPVYQYACTDCGEQLEVRQSFTDDALTVCPACDGRLRKVLSAVGVVFKGSGFYRTDSREAAKSTAGAAAKNGSSPDAGSSSDSSSTPSTTSTTSTTGSSSDSSASTSTPATKAS